MLAWCNGLKQDKQHKTGQYGMVITALFQKVIHEEER